MAVNRFDQLIEHWDAILKKAFLAAVYELRNQAQIEQITRMLEKGDVDAALRAVGLDPSAYRTFERQINAAFEAGGVATTSHLPAVRQPDGYRLVVRFDVRNIAAEQWLREHAAGVVREINVDQRRMVRGALEAGMRAGQNPRDVALDIAGRIGATGRREGGLVGLTDSQAEWVRNYETELRAGSAKALTRDLRDKRFDGTVRKAIERGEPLKSDQIRTMVAAYKNRALRFRAEAIARSEAIEALHTAQEQAMQQAVASGAVQQDVVSFIWRSTHDNRVRDTHRAMDGQEQPMGQAFISPSGARLRYPGDPLAPAAEVVNCRCWREPKIDFLAGVR